MIDFILGFESGVLAVLGIAAFASYLARRRATRQLDDARERAEKATNELVSVMQNIAAMPHPATRPIETATIIPLKKDTQNDPQN